MNSCRTYPLFIGDENWVKEAKRFVGGNPNTNQIKKVAVGNCQKILTAVGRPGRSTANGRISDRWEGGRPGRSTEVPKQRVSLSVGRPVRSTEEKQRALLLFSVDRSVDRCAHMHKGACRSTDTVNRQSNSALPAVDRAVDRTRSKTDFRKGFEDRIF